MGTMNRRRFISITAAAAGCGLAWPAVAATPLQEAVSWRGQALGAPTSLVIYHQDPVAAERLLRQVRSEVDRLEQIFSLYRPGSAISQLNRLGALAMPPSELVALLETCRKAWEVTGGVFDPTVQPLWKVLAEHFSMPGASAGGPTSTEIREALDLVGFDKVSFDQSRVAFGRPGMALTLNGIAQGYITDRAVELLRRSGIEKSIIDLGEIRVLGSKPDGGPWQVGIRDVATPAGRAAAIELVDKAVATSSAAGFSFDAAGRFTHLLNPRTGASVTGDRSVTVTARDAAKADAFSTAFSLMSSEDIRAVVKREGDIDVMLSDSRDGWRTP
ncbi:FAD:protein FMN transferase [Stappia sp. TSB10GB4]|uniref:FAD:protein FMN transferase n=1 Tax=Stappia sp. TSB10GB4 TaxID=2003584 RepID=UPI001646A1BE|nr:FAD:protein FMN transferase [Stappia sp. TSB10GB4]